MKFSTLPNAVAAFSFSVACSYSYAHDDSVGREKEFRYGYQVGYITAIRDSSEGATMCTKGIPLLEIIQAIGAYNKSNGISSETEPSAKNITSALSAKFPCQRKQK